MQPEASVQQLCRQIEQAVHDSEQAIDALGLLLDDSQCAQLSHVCFALKSLCVDATNRAQAMAQFVARNTAKLSELYALYQKLGGREQRLLHAQATGVTLYAPNAAIYLDTPTVPQRALRQDVAQQFEQMRLAMAGWLDECQRFSQWAPLDVSDAMARRDALHGATVRELALFGVDDAVADVLRQLAQQQHNLQHHQSNTVRRYAECARLYEAATRQPEPPSTMASMFVPV